MKRWQLLVALALLPACVGVQRAADSAGENSVSASLALALGAVLGLVSGVGALWGAGIAAGGWFMHLFTRGPVEGGGTPASPWIGLALVAAGVLLLRSWAHWLPPLLEVLKRTAKGTPRALLGGRARASQTLRPPRRVD